ncbi:uncharacterized protein CIMG_12665 [Coccidioides immitis RS]|uniref:Uncharacterized protein n=1 Tax=Coccidioides immitis (strain RS) TaxID=246410 RepID=A0A0D8JS79_COCIM|nr:uncharacterized protein CIMG_12665 [Coccidioides immitis RS]KJF59994.1 hypothetical protein CIMG_12665 [Coccidioides immitis RS]
MSQKHVKNVKKIDHKNNSNISMYCCQNSNKLFAYFAKHFDSEKFFKIFFWAEPIVNYEKSKQLEQWSNCMIISWRNQADYMGQHLQYKNVNKENFAEKRKETKKKTRASASGADKSNPNLSSTEAAIILTIIQQAKQLYSKNQLFKNSCQKSTGGLLVRVV